MKAVSSFWTLDFDEEGEIFERPSWITPGRSPVLSSKQRTNYRKKNRRR